MTDTERITNQVYDSFFAPLDETELVETTSEGGPRAVRGWTLAGIVSVAFWALLSVGGYLIWKWVTK